MSRRKKAQQLNTAEAVRGPAEGGTAAGAAARAGGFIPPSEYLMDWAPAKLERSELSGAVVQDAFSNPLYRLGWGSQSPLEATEYPLTRMTDNYALLNSLYRDNWVVQNVVGLMVDDMLREWYDIKGITPEMRDALERVERKTRLRERLAEGLRWGRLYGGAAGLIMIDGQEDLSQPLDLDMVYPGAFQGLYILDRWQGVVPNMRLVFEGGEPVPDTYSITDALGHTVVSVHHSRVVRFTGRDLPYLERVAEMYWGESEIEALYKDVVAHDNVSANMAALTFQANINTMEYKGVEQLLSVASPAVQRRFWSVMQAQSVLRSNFGMQVVEQGTKLTNQQYSFAGLQDVYESMCLNLCGASHYPMTRLFGRSPGGLNATGESDLRNYYDYVDSQRESKLRPAVQKLLPVLAMSAWGGIPDDLDFVFPPLWTPTAKELADIAKVKAEAVVTGYQAGLLNVDTAQKELKKLEDETGMFGSITDEEIAANAGKTYQDATALRDPLMGLGFEGQAADSFPVSDYSPNQPRGKDGRWIPYGASSGTVDLSGERFSDGESLNEHFGGSGGLLARKKSAEGKWVSSLTPEEARSVSEYTADLYGDVNSYLRGYGEKLGVSRQAQVNEGIKNIDSALAKFENPSELITYRAINPEAFAGTDLNSLVGKVYTDNAYMSTSPLLGSSAVNKNLLMEIRVPSGRNRGAYVNKLAGQYQNKEYEYLLPRGSRFNIVGITEIGGKPTIQMEMI